MKYSSALIASALLSVSTAAVGEDMAGEVAELKQALSELKSSYESRISELEARLERAEKTAASAKGEAAEAYEIAEETSITQSSGASAPNTFNPAMGAVLVARFADLGDGWEAVPGFQPGGELGPGGSGFSLGESEVNFKANIDTAFFGNLTLALEDEGGETEIGVEEAWIQTTGLSDGLTVTAGRFFSGVGYLNKSHRHADDFADRPLPYQAFFGGQYIADGVQARWLAPTPVFLEIGTELDWGSAFPGSPTDDTSPDTWSLFAKVGGDVGMSNSWQLGFSWVSADVNGRGAGEDAESDPLFFGDSDLAGVDFVWKWAPDGNSLVRNLKLQGEWFRRSEDGVFASLPYDGEQDGWYLQGVYQWRQGWRVGYRHDVASADNGPLFAGTFLEDPGRTSQRDSLMVDWSLSEYSRLRLQYTYDRVLPAKDNQVFLQYLMSLGAHGAHAF